MAVRVTTPCIREPSSWTLCGEARAGTGCKQPGASGVSPLGRTSCKVARETTISWVTSLPRGSAGVQARTLSMRGVAMTRPGAAPEPTGWAVPVAATTSSGSQEATQTSAGPEATCAAVRGGPERPPANAERCHVPAWLSDMNCACGAPGEIRTPNLLIRRLRVGVLARHRTARRLCRCPPRRRPRVCRCCSVSTRKSGGPMDSLSEVTVRKSVSDDRLWRTDLRSPQPCLPWSVGGQNVRGLASDLSVSGVSFHGRLLRVACGLLAQRSERIL